MGIVTRMEPVTETTTGATTETWFLSNISETLHKYLNTVNMAKQWRAPDERIRIQLVHGVLREIEK